MNAKKNDDLEEALPEKDPTEILNTLQGHLQEFPEGPEVTFTASYLDSSVANDGIVAYYMQPPIDDIVNNVIKINGDNVNSTKRLPSLLMKIIWSVPLTVRAGNLEI